MVKVVRLWSVRWSVCHGEGGRVVVSKVVSMCA